MRLCILLALAAWLLVAADRPPQDVLTQDQVVAAITKLRGEVRVVETGLGIEPE
jgi:hypothetical protein